MTEEEAKAEGLFIDCPNGHREWMHPGEPASEDPFFCGECGHVFGTWGEVRRRLFVGEAMLEAVLARKS